MISRKILGSSNPSATTETDIYTVPAGKEALAAVFITNLSTSAGATIRVAVGSNGAGSIANSDYIAYEVQLDPRMVIKLHPIALDTGDIITVYASTANVTFKATGLEIDS